MPLNSELVQAVQAKRLVSNKYGDDYLEAVHLFQYMEYERAIEAAKYNLTEPTLPRYHQIKNMILIVAAEEDWDEAEHYRLRAEAIYETANRLTAASDKDAQSSLRQVRNGLDELKRSQAAEQAKWAMEDEGNEEDEEDEDDEDDEADGEEWADEENAIEVVEGAVEDILEDTEASKKAEEGGVPSRCQPDRGNP
ncbi:hypothetical protein LTR37_000202 [Vermiconidia calcicola]|uniref:Uncharacterized protein n=1 Tax=Vermiconidia calcicola TaxID=1690605 RepID=A0ACC3P1U8_9PEZI|nr:hypothetical protein LTR37_000202 [Vermiconidia calcicola]